MKGIYRVRTLEQLEKNYVRQCARNDRIEAKLVYIANKIARLQKKASELRREQPDTGVLNGTIHTVKEFGAHATGSAADGAMLVRRAGEWFKIVGKMNDQGERVAWELQAYKED